MKENFEMAISEEIVQGVDELVAECDHLGASRSQIVEAISSRFNVAKSLLLFIASESS